MDNQEKKLNNEDIEKKEENIEDINKKIDSLKLQISESKKQINDIELRKLANIENIKKSTIEKIKIIKKIQTEQFLKQIIPIIDSLEDALTVSKKLNSNNTVLIEGIKLTLQSFLDTLNKLDVTIEGKEEELFDSNLHDAITIEKSNTIPPNHIISVKKKGFMLKKKLLRKAQVIVSKE
ncbi:nucleotide exchange factor GrpE [Buchnera aphidicola]|uniref:Protein GrpE n=1 Tax=Buchnera aphidicola (Lipaphis pseudobrassicae) TaxID=1258543 RepID=A0A4D6Y082_9GAMM|nr:nucleotide exchange factor GrpE [Buchnera aphidicola]QCI22063.1 nucleotide exchange factor GrpE [Buchnera aphidicola (Lipaphis pseudobrassicae)]